MKPFFYRIQSLDRTLTRCDTVSSQKISAVWQRQQKTAISSWLSIGMSCVFVVTTLPRQAMADPAVDAPNLIQTAPVITTTTTPMPTSAISTTVPDGICAVAAIVAGGGGGGGATSTSVSGGLGGAGASIKAKFQVLPLQAVTGTVGVSGITSGGGTLASLGGSGTASGGAGGTVPSTGGHRGAGGGGSSSISVAGLKLIEAGGGGGGGAAHNNTPVASGGNAGFSSIAPGTAAPGSNGSNGTDGTNTVNGGQGGQATAGGAGGSNTGNVSLLGLAGGGIGIGNGGNGGPDPNFDAGGGGGGGYTGGGGGASTVNTSVSGGGGGGGSSFVRSTSPTAVASAPTSIAGAVGSTTANNTNGAAGAVTLDWIPCVYSLGITKSVSPTAVKVGNKVIWTVTVTNSGPDPMTRGDTINLTDTLPTTGIGSATPQFKVLSLATTGTATDPNLNSGLITCTGVTVGAAMPPSTVCSRPYSSASPGLSSATGTRGLNSGETLTITYEEIFANKTGATTVTNTASTKDRSSTTGTTDIIGVTAPRSASANVTLQPYDLKVFKSVSSATIAPGSTLTWTVDVTNLGSADMEGPAETAANPLIVTDVAPTTNVFAPIGFTSIGSAGICTYLLGTITCSKGLLAGQTQTFTFQQVVDANAPINATISNTATVSDYVTGDSNDSSTSTVSTMAASSGNPNLLLVKRITRISGSQLIGSQYDLSKYINDPNDIYDDNVITSPMPSKPDTDKWPDTTSSTSSTFLIGGINGGKVKPKDEIEYTIYFLSTGDVAATNVMLCDRIPSNTTFVPYSFNTYLTQSSGSVNDSRGILALINGVTASYTNVGDGDAARYVPAGTVPKDANNNVINCGGPNDNGAVIFDLGNLPNATAPGTPNSSYGFVRFQGQVK